MYKVVGFEQNGQWNHLRCRHIEKEVLGEQPPGKHSHALSGESAHLGASLKCLYTNAYSIGNKKDCCRWIDALEEREATKARRERCPLCE